MELLILLVQRQGELVSRDEIARHIWGGEVFLDLDHSINTAIRKIRQALQDDPEKPRFLETIIGKGYRFAAPVTASNGNSNPANPDELSRIVPLPMVQDTRPGTNGSQVAANLGEEKVPDVATAVQTQGPGEPRMLRTYRWPLVGLAAVLIFGLAFVLLKSRHPDGIPPKITSLAVLPLKNLSGDPAQGYLADGMTEELIGRLAGIHGLRVISHTSVMQFQDPKQTVPEIARTLGVDAIVEGSVIRDGNHIRVHAQLIRASNDEHFWSQTYDRDMGDVLSLESDIAQSIAEQVEVTVSGREHTLLAASRQVSPEAYESFLKGVYADHNSRAGLEQSLAFFEDAIKKDPTFAPSYLGLANVYGILGSPYGGISPAETSPKAFAAVHKALDLNPDLAEAHMLLAAMYEEEWKWQESEAEYKRALALKPNDAAGHRGYAGWLLSQGRLEEAVTWAKSAHELDPLDVGMLVDNGFLLFQARHYDESIQTLRDALAVQPDDVSAHWFLGYSLIAKGQPAQAIAELEEAARLSDRNAVVIGVLVRAYAHAGQRDHALRLLTELKTRKEAGYVPSAAFVNAYLGLEDNEQAIAWLERAYEEKSNIVMYLKTHPYFDPLRSDPRFADLLHSVGLDREYQSSL